jgi:hypothetical protein
LCHSERSEESRIFFLNPFTQLAHEAEPRAQSDPPACP